MCSLLHSPNLYIRFISKYFFTINRCFSDKFYIDPNLDYIEIEGTRYKKDLWTNITPKILKLMNRKLYLQPNNAIYLLSQLTRNFFRNFYEFHHDSPITTKESNFDSLLIPNNHASRNKSDTYYINSENLLRTHTSTHQAQSLQKGLLNFICIADCYRRDAVDSSHYPAFHQCEIFKTFHESEFSEGIFSMHPRNEHSQENHYLNVVKKVEEDLKHTLQDFIAFVLPETVEYRWVKAFFPFTHPSWELEILYKNKWLEVLGAGIVENKILENNSIKNKISWAAGFGLERIAMIRYKIPDLRIFWIQDSGIEAQFINKCPSEHFEYKPISNYPQIINDLSFWLPSDKWYDNDFYDIVRTIGSDLVEQVNLIDSYKNKEGRNSRCYRIVYRSYDRALSQKEVSVIHNNIAKQVTKLYSVEIR